MITAQELARVLGARRSGRQFVCKCPAHDDRTPSLIFWQGHSAVRFKCYAGCEPEDIIAALRRRGLLPNGGPPRARGPQRPSSSPPSSPSSPSSSDPEDERQRARTLALVERVCRESEHIAGTDGMLYFHNRGLDISRVPDCGGLRFHPRCPFGSGNYLPCIIGRYTDVITGERKGIWRRPITGETARALGPVARCVIRLWPDEDVTTSLTLGEGVESVLSGALRITHRGTLFQPAWAAGCADNVRNFAILPGIEVLNLLVDNDANSVGQDAAAECARRYVAAGRQVVRLTPTEEGADFNDIILGKHHHGR